jgi:hypothetical protein
VLDCEVFVFELFQPVDTSRAGAVAVEEVASLAHEVFDLRGGVRCLVIWGRGEGTDDSVELAAFVALGSSEVVLRFAGAELAEVLSCFGNYICEELELDSAEWLAWMVLDGLVWW